MSRSPSQNSLDKLVDLTRSAILWRRRMDPHLRSNVLPYLGTDGPGSVQLLLVILDEEDITTDLATCLDAAIMEIRDAIAAGTTEKRIPIPRKRLIGCEEAYETETVLSPEAEALREALPEIEACRTATWIAVDHAEAVRLSLRMLDLD